VIEWVAEPGAYVEPASWSRSGTNCVVDDRSISPGGREPLSRSSFHSYPSAPAASVAEPLSRLDTRVLRHNRRPASAAGTWIASFPLLTMEMVPASAFP